MALWDVGQSWPISEIACAESDADATGTINATVNSPASYAYLHEPASKAGVCRNLD